jgi:type II secretory pathway predicted ATPase ExeA
MRKQKSAQHDLDRYRQHWGATDVPFTEDHLERPYTTPQHERILDHLQQTIVLRTTFLLTGENGTGKSILLGHFVHQQHDLKRYHPLIVTQASLSGIGFLLAYLL